MKYKRKLKKYELGVQKMEVPQLESPAESFMTTNKDSAKGMAAGAAIGGPWGALIGTAVGLAKGLVKTGIRRHEQKAAQGKIERQNNYIDKYGSVADDPNLQFYQARKGMDLTKYKKGSIYIKPEKAEDGKDLTGDKKPIKAGKAVISSGGTTRTLTYYNADKRKAKAAGDSTGVNRYSHEEPHYNPTVYGHNFGQMPKRQKYEHGTKMIEAEKDELIFAKNGDKFALKADLKGQPTHEQGGVVVNAKSGDVIFPGKKREEILTAYKRGDNKKIDKERQKLPKDSASTKKAQDGLRMPRRKTMFNNLNTSSMGVNPADTEDEFDNPIVGLGSRNTTFKNLNTSGMGVNAGDLADRNTNTEGTVNPYTRARDYSSLYAIAESAPTEYNLVKGAAGKVAQTNRRFYQPDRYKYTDTTQPLLRQSNEIAETQKRNVANMRGNRGQQLNALNQIASNRFEREQGIIGQGVAGKANIANMNTEARNAAKMTNLNLANQYDVQDLQNKAKQTEYLGKGLEGVSQSAYNRELMSYLKSRDKTLMNTLSTEDYDVTPEGKVVYRRKARKGMDMTKKNC